MVLAQKMLGSTLRPGLWHGGSLNQYIVSPTTQGWVWLRNQLRRKVQEIVCHIWPPLESKHDQVDSLDSDFDRFYKNTKSLRKVKYDTSFCVTRWLGGEESLGPMAI